mmetsp:Transcript_10761/g.30793  ORF Transcript_10761/g.30793 Transcript_10761/m.30793 type:complete len:181 (+) Transcript_10761:4215-4757(+)
MDCMAYACMFSCRAVSCLSQPKITLRLGYSCALHCSLCCCFSSDTKTKTGHGCQARQGTLPASIGNYNRLRFLDLSNAGLTGSIPTELGKATSLEIVTLNFNNLNDTVPAELADLPELHTLQLEGNDLTGIVPQPVCNKLFEFAVTFVTDCFAPVQIECPCCTSCWSDESEGYVYPQTTP